MIHMFHQYQYAIMTPNFNCFTYMLMHSTHSSSMSPVSQFLPCFNFYLFSIYFQCNFCCFWLFQQLRASAAISTLSVTYLFWQFSAFFHAFAIAHIENKKVLKYNQMVNAKLLIMLDCKQLIIWLSLTRGIQLARKHIIAHR